MVDWTFLDTRKKVTLAIGAGALVVAVAVLGATVVRISNLRTVLERPRAASTYDNSKRFPECAPGGKEPSCCANMAAGGVDACGWPERGWCSNEHCEAGKNGGGPNTCSTCQDGSAGCEDNQCKIYCREEKCNRNGKTYSR